MSLFTKQVSVVKTGNDSLTISIPRAFAREMDIKRGDKVTVVYNPKEKSITVLNPPPQAA